MEVDPMALQNHSHALNKSDDEIANTFGNFKI